MNDNLLKDYALSIIIGELTNDSKISEENRLKSYIEAFEFIYSDNYRHEYSKVTRVLFDINNPEQRDFIAEQLNFIANNISNEKIKIKLNKLSDHINLEIIRMRELSRISEDATKASEKAIDIDKKLLSMNDKTKQFDKKIRGFNQDINKAKKQLNSLQKSVKNTTTEFVTILSIFAAIVIGFTGGMSYISNAIISLSQIGPYRACVFILLIGIIMFNTIFLLLYMIAKITKNNIASIGKCKNPKDGCDKKKLLCCINRYPYIVWFNIIAFSLIICSIIFYGIDRYNLITCFINYITNALPWYKLLMIILLVIGISFIVYKFVKKAINVIVNNKCNYESSK